MHYYAMCPFPKGVPLSQKLKTKKKAVKHDKTYTHDVITHVNVHKTYKNIYICAIL